MWVCIGQHTHFTTPEGVSVVELLLAKESTKEHLHLINKLVEAFSIVQIDIMVLDRRVS